MRISPWVPGFGMVHRAAYDPEVMVALLLYGYCQGERSSRVIERRCVREVGYRVITGGLRPGHATIARFRARRDAALGGLFSQVLRLLAAARTGWPPRIRPAATRSAPGRKPGTPPPLPGNGAGDGGLPPSRRAPAGSAPSRGRIPPARTCG